MKLKMKHEAEYEESLREEEEKIQEIEKMKKGIDLNLDTAKPSIYHVIRFLTLYFVRFLPTAKCPGCNKKLV